MGDDVVQYARLGVRTRLILGLAATGMTNGEIANHLGVSHAEVDRHVREAMAALSARSRLEAAVIGLMAGLIHPSVLHSRRHALTLVGTRA